MGNQGTWIGRAARAAAQDFARSHSELRARPALTLILCLISIFGGVASAMGWGGAARRGFDALFPMSLALLWWSFALWLAIAAAQGALSRRASGEDEHARERGEDPGR